jgi:hypothetical protein
MEVGQGPNWGCSAKGGKNMDVFKLSYAERTIVGIRMLKRKKNKKEKGEVRRGDVIGGEGKNGRRAEEEENDV